MERIDTHVEYSVHETIRRAGPASEPVGGERNRKRLSAISRAIPRERNDWPEDQQFEYLVGLLSWRIGKSKAAVLVDRLAQEFGALPDILSASDYRLLQIPGVGTQTVEFFRLVRELAERFAFIKIRQDQPILASWTALLDYFRVKMAFETVEQLRVVFLDRKNRLIADEVQWTGTIDHTPIYPREIIRRALELSATALIICHNHPSGDPSPSSADIRMTREIVDAARPLGMVVHDHVIIGKSGHASLRKLKLI